MASLVVLGPLPVAAPCQGSATEGYQNEHTLVFGRPAAARPASVQLAWSHRLNGAVLPALPNAFREGGPISPSRALDATDVVACRQPTASRVQAALQAVGEFSEGHSQRVSDALRGRDARGVPSALDLAEVLRVHAGDPV